MQICYAPLAASRGAEKHERIADGDSLLRTGASPFDDVREVVETELVRQDSVSDEMTMAAELEIRHDMVAASVFAVARMNVNSAADNRPTGVLANLLDRSHHGLVGILPAARVLPASADVIAVLEMCRLQEQTCCSA